VLREYAIVQEAGGGAVEEIVDLPPASRAKAVAMAAADDFALLLPELEPALVVRRRGTAQ
jgi:hypothetical protein